MTCHFLPFLGKELVSKQVLASKVNRKYEQMHENSVNCGLGRGGEGGEIVILVLVIVIVVVVGLTRKSRRANYRFILPSFFFLVLQLALTTTVNALISIKNDT
ncbi:hypothetical protein V1477_009414, partial [Vespula maculifrons]